MPVRPTLLHRMALVSFLLFRKNLGKLREFFGLMVYRPPWQKIARTPMIVNLGDDPSAKYWYSTCTHEKLSQKGCQRRLEIGYQHQKITAPILSNALIFCREFGVYK